MNNGHSIGGSIPSSKLSRLIQIWEMYSKPMKPVSGANYDTDPIVGGVVYPEARKIHAGVGDEGAARCGACAERGLKWSTCKAQRWYVWYQSVTKFDEISAMAFSNKRDPKKRKRWSWKKNMFPIRLSLLRWSQSALYSKNDESR